MLAWVVVLAIVMGASLYITKGVSNAETDNRPNVIVIFTDDMRTDDLKFMPQTRKLIGQQGATFNRFYSNNPLCCPFRASVLDGRYTHNNNVLSNNPAYGGGVKRFNETKTIAPHLQENGYKTAYIGKYLNGYKKETANYIPPGWDEWFVPVAHIYKYTDTVINHNGKMSTYPGYVTDLYAKRTNNTIRSFSEADKPFVMYVSHLAPHGAEGERPPIPAKRHRGTVKPRHLPKITSEADVTDKPSWIRRLPKSTPVLDGGYSAELWRIRRAESVKSVDDAVASMVQTLRETGELDNTVIMFTSDNGFMTGEHRLPTGKVVPYEQSARVPMLVRGPGFKPGITRPDVAGTVDIAPTILDLADVTVPYEMDGRPLFKWDLDRKMLLESGAYLTETVTTGDPSIRSYVGVVDRYYKYIEYWDGQREFYPMSGDRREQQSLIDPKTGRVKEGYADELKIYQEALEQLKNCVGTSCQL